MKVCECVDKKLTVYKANKVVEAGYRLTLNEQRVVLACISMINSNKPLTASDKFELSAKEFAAKSKNAIFKNVLIMMLTPLNNSKHNFQNQPLCLIIQQTR